MDWKEVKWEREREKEDGLEDEGIRKKREEGERGENMGEGKGLERE